MKCVDVKVHMAPDKKTLKWHFKSKKVASLWSRASSRSPDECGKEGKSPATEIRFHILDPVFFWMKNVLIFFFLPMENFSGEMSALFGRTDNSLISRGRELRWLENHKSFYFISL